MRRLKQRESENRRLQTAVADGPEFVSKAVDQWAARRGVSLRFIDPGKPIQNAYIESFNGKFRDECLSQHWFISLAQARTVSEEWRTDYNERRPLPEFAVPDTGRVRG